VDTDRWASLIGMPLPSVYDGALFMEILVFWQIATSLVRKDLIGG
jgi:hypothetical protein